jgi:hypothetical protein
MWKGLVKASSHVKMTPEAPTVPVTSPSHHYSTEAIDYVHGILGGKISGVASALVNECPVCTKILKEYLEMESWGWRSKCPQLQESCRRHSYW